MSFAWLSLVVVGLALMLQSYAHEAQTDAGSMEAYVAASTPATEEEIATAMQLVGCYSIGLNGPQVVGGYQPVELPNDNVNALATQAAIQYANDSNDATFQSCNVENVEVQVLAACSQVVAGTNYIIAFQANYPCGMNATETDLVAEIFQPLPSSNELPEVISVAPMS